MKRTTVRSSSRARKARFPSGHLRMPRMWASARCTRRLPSAPISPWRRTCLSPAPRARVSTGAPSTAAPERFSNLWTFPPAPPSSWAAAPSPCSRWWPSPGRWTWSARCSFSTSPPRLSTSRRCRSSSSSCSTSRRRAWASSSSPTSSSRSMRSATGSPCCGTASWWASTSLRICPGCSWSPRCWVRIWTRWPTSRRITPARWI